MSTNNKVQASDAYWVKVAPESRDSLAAYKSKWTIRVAQQYGVPDGRLDIHMHKDIGESNPTALVLLKELRSLGDQLVSANEGAAPESTKDKLRSAIVAKEHELAKHIHLV